MLASFFRQPNSTLYDNNTFYQALEKDVQACKSEVIIESPFITMRRLESLLPYLRAAKSKGVRIIVNTKSPDELEGYLRSEAERGITVLQDAEIEVLITGGHHRKLAIFDRAILWEGSLNIFSQNDSCEIMRRTKSEKLANEMVRFIGLERFLNH